MFEQLELALGSHDSIGTDTFTLEAEGQIDESSGLAASWYETGFPMQSLVGLVAYEKPKLDLQ